MPIARFCICGDVASNHRMTAIPNDNPPPKKTLVYHDCQVDYCTCTQYKHAKTINSNMENHE